MTGCSFPVSVCQMHVPDVTGKYEQVSLEYTPAQYDQELRMSYDNIAQYSNFKVASSTNAANLSSMLDQSELIS